MAGWDSQHREGTFCSVPVRSAANRVMQLIERYRPQVVVTYDPHSTAYIRTRDTTGTFIPEDDLFAGLANHFPTALDL